MAGDGQPELESFVGGDHDATERESPESGVTARVRPVARPAGQTYPIPGLGDRIGRYVSLRILGRGGMGIVIAAHDPELDRQVAIKLVHPQVWRQASVEAREMLRQEARAMARLVHPNVVTVHDLGTVGDQLFVAMELVAGSSLEAWLKQPRPWREALALCRDAGRGVAAAHRAGLVHRDIKPSNVLLDEHGRARIADFGLVVLARGEREPDPDGASPAGTPAYMSPEQHRMQNVTAASDQFSFCVMVYEALYGERPFAGRTAAAIAVEIDQGRVKPAPPRSPVPSSIRKALIRGLAREPGDRFASLDELLAALEPRPVGRWVAAGALVVVAAGAGAAAVMLTGASETPAQAARRAAEARAAAVWSPAAQRDVRAALGGGGAAHAAATGERVIAGIDRYVTGWIATRVDVAGAVHAGEQAAVALEWRMACLDRRLDEVRALVAELGGGGPSVATRALDGVAALTAAQVCVDRDVAAMRPPPEEPARLARHAELVKVLAEVNAKLRLGKRKDAVAQAERLVVDARALADPPLLAEATLLHAIVLQSAGEFDKSVARYREAVLAAAAAGEPRMEARAWSDLIILSVNAGRGRPADDVIMAARAAITRAGDAPEVALPFEQAMAMVAIAEGRPADAERHWRTSKELAAAGLPADHPRQATVRLGIATSLAEQHKLEEAMAAVIEARDVALTIFGPEHPEMAAYWGNLSVLQHGLARYEDAVASAERVIAVAEPGTVYAGLGPLYKAGALVALGRSTDALAVFAAAAAEFRKHGNHTQEFQALMSLGLEQYNSEMHADAKATLEQALEVGARAFGPRAWQMAYTTTVLGMIAEHDQEYELSSRRCRDAAEWLEAQHGVDSSNLVISLICISRAERSLGKIDRALAERAIALADTGPVVHDQVEARLELARVLVQGRGDRRRVRTLAQEALARSTDPEQQAGIKAEFLR